MASLKRNKKKNIKFSLPLGFYRNWTEEAEVLQVISFRRNNFMALARERKLQQQQNILCTHGKLYYLSVIFYISNNNYWLNTVAKTSFLSFVLHIIRKQWSFPFFTTAKSLSLINIFFSIKISIDLQEEIAISCQLMKIINNVRIVVTIMRFSLNTLAFIYNDVKTIMYSFFCSTAD